MDYYSSQISKLIEELSKLPGIGNKTAQRLAFHIINMPEEQVERLSSSIRDAKHNVHYCKECFTLTDQELCPICRSQTRDHSVIMVVENPRDLAAYGQIRRGGPGASRRDLPDAWNRPGRYQIKRVDDASSDRGSKGSHYRHKLKP